MLEEDKISTASSRVHSLKPSASAEVLSSKSHHALSKPRKNFLRSTTLQSIHEDRDGLANPNPRRRAASSFGFAAPSLDEIPSRGEMTPHKAVPICNTKEGVAVFV